MNVRNFKSLTNDEIRKFLTNEFELVKDIQDKDIQRNKDEIEVTIYIMPEYPEIPDTLTLTIDGIDTNDFETETESYHWQQYLLAKGIHPLLENNHYIDDIENDIER